MIDNTNSQNQSDVGSNNDNKRIQGGYIGGNFSGNYNNSGDYVEGILYSVHGEGNVLTFNQTEILQISEKEITARKLITTSPYQGLKQFESRDKELFFGRDNFITTLVDELEHTNLVLLLGASGSGKSSVVRAGLIPWLERKYGTEFVNLTFTPDADPFDSLYASLLGNKYSQKEAKMARDVRAETLIQVAANIKQPDKFWLIFIDQFEELFTFSDENKRSEFVNGLIKLSQAKLPKLKIIATMRADFFERLREFPQLVGITQKHRPMIIEMQPGELRLAIEQPAAHHGVVFEAGLIDTIIASIQGQAGCLPLLQYTLNLLWLEEVKTCSINDQTLNISTYDAIGGVRGALQKHVDSIYKELSESEKQAVQRIFLKLVSIGENAESGIEWKPVRRRALLSEFGDDERAMLLKLVNENLLVSNADLSDNSPKKALFGGSKSEKSDSTIEIIHEILLSCWDELRYWIQKNRQDIALRNRLYEDVKRWKIKNQPEDELWSGSKLEQILELRKDDNFHQVLGGFNDDANQFIEQSVGLRDRQRRRTIIGLTGFSIVALILAGAAGLGWWSTESQRQQTITGLTTASQELFNSNKEFDALLASINAGKQVKQAAFGVNSDAEFQVKAALQQAISGVKEQNRLEGHKDGVISVSFSPNRPLLASASRDHTVKLWNIDTGKEVNTLTGHKAPVSVVSFSPDGRLLASASFFNNTVKLWDIATGKEIFNFSGYEADSNGNKGISFSPDGRLLAVASKGNTIQLLDIAIGKQIVTLHGHSAKVNGVSFSPDGRMLASASFDGTVKLWDVVIGKEIPTNMRHSGFVESVSFSPHGRILASGADGGSIKLWDVVTRKEIETRNRKTLQYPGRVTNLSFSPNGRQLVASGFNNVAKLWDVATRREISTFSGHLAQVSSVNFSPDGKWLATASDDRIIKLWYIAQRSEIKNLSEYGNDVKGVSFSPDGRLLASGSQDYTIKLWDVATGKEIPTNMRHSYWVESVSFSPDGRLLASASWDNTVKLWDVSTRKEIPTNMRHSGWVTSVSFSPDGRLLASASWDKTVKLWDVSTGKEISTLSGHNRVVYSVSFSPDGRLLASGSSDGTIKLWDVSEHQEIATITPQARGVKNVSFSPDGRLLASTSDNTITLWDVATRKEIDTLTGHKVQITSVGFSPDGKTLASASKDHSIILWDVTTGKKINIFNAKAEVNSISFSRNGRWLASGSVSGEVTLWNLEALSNFTLENLLARGCDWVSNYLQTNPNVNNSDKQLCNGIGKTK
ncbi:MAG: WD40 repeat domain-containing protein [Rhizonema sp. NSF051]|nr:WD40 repeat domain-containing protein [Rhizonema sp. NSF051]